MTANNSVQVELKSYIHVDTPPLNYVSPQVHSCYEIVFYNTGSGKTLIGGNLYDFNAGDIAIIEPETVHDELCSTGSEIYCCLFSFEGPLQLKNGLYSLRHLENYQEMLNPVLQLFGQIQSELYQKQFAFEVMLDSLMGQLLVHICRIYSRIYSRTRSSSDGIEYVKMYIKENYTRRLNFQILADHVGYSCDRLRHIFKEKVGVPPSRYLLNVRIQRAKELLVSTDNSIESIAKATGFGSASRFVETFRLEIGQTPKAYRELNRGNDVTRIL